ncbi:hypothetical protein FRX31_019530, partial [Thalictrum thalictroides]
MFEHVEEPSSTGYVLFFSAFPSVGERRSTYTGFCKLKSDVSVSPLTVLSICLLIRVEAFQKHGDTAILYFSSSLAWVNMLWENWSTLICFLMAR